MYLNEILGALTDPSRRKIIKLLSKKNLNAGQIGKHFDITAPSLSHHLATLRQAELVEQERQGRQLIYSLKRQTLEKTAEQLLNLIKTK
ncbi:MAG TPA: metalloregulator ArsR/SmtB family transcription factor [bacterium]|nr:metalloregulator ArsR/SmtB family transcription factor [bacterium]